MTTVSIPLTDEQLARIDALAHGRHQSREQTLAELVRTALSSDLTPATAETIEPFASVLDIAGILTGERQVDSRLHDTIIAEEATDSHDDAV